MYFLKQDVIKLGVAQRTFSPDILSDPTNEFFIRHAHRYPGMTVAQAKALFEQDCIDIEIMFRIGRDAQTVLFEADFVLGLGNAIGRFPTDGDLKLPFENMVIQFDKPVPETRFFEEEYIVSADEIVMKQRASDQLGIDSLQFMTPSGEDTVLGMVVGRDTGDHINVIAIFASMEIQRVRWKPGEGFAHHVGVDYDRHDGKGLANKGRLIQLTTACITYMNCRNVAVERSGGPSRRLAERRAKKGMPPLPEWYICKITKSYGVSKEEKDHEEAEQRQASGRHVSYMFPVAGHFRKVGDGNIWIGSHYRGIEHAGKSAPDKVYKYASNQAAAAQMEKDQR